MRIDPETIAEAFNVNCPKKHWTARIVRAHYQGIMREMVSFKDRTGLITLTYDADDGDCRKFAISWNRAHAVWGDYINAIAKGLHTVMAALQAGGLPFVAPVSLDDIIVRTQFAAVGGRVTVEVEHRQPSEQAEWQVNDPLRTLEPALDGSELL